MNYKDLEKIYAELKKEYPDYECPHIYYEKEILTTDTGDLICKECKESDFAPRFREDRQKKIDKMLSDYETLRNK